MVVGAKHCWRPEPLGWDPLPPRLGVFSTVLGELRRAPFPPCSRGPQEEGAGPEEAARSPNELRKAHLLTITAQGPAITSCRERQEVCLGAAACGSPTARVCPSV